MTARHVIMSSLEIKLIQSKSADLKLMDCHRSFSDPLWPSKFQFVYKFTVHFSRRKPLIVVIMFQLLMNSQ